MSKTSPYIALVTGLPGTGKSTLAVHSQKNSVKGWSAFDFDKGKYKIPPTDNTAIQLKQLVWWLEKAESLYQENGAKSVIFGFWGFPENVEKASLKAGIDTKTTKVGYLYTDIDSLRLRDVRRGNKELYEGKLTGWKSDFINNLDAGGAQRFDTSNVSAEETYNEIKDWLLKLD